MKEKLSDIIQGIINSNDFIEEGLSCGYINLTQFATFIQPMIHEHTKDEGISIEAIKMSLSRIKKGLSPEEKKLFTLSNIKVYKYKKVANLLEDESESLLNNMLSSYKNNNPALIRINLDMSIPVSQIYYKISKVLYFYNITLLTLYENDSILTMAVEEEDIKKAFSLISKL